MNVTLPQDRHSRAQLVLLGLAALTLLAVSLWKSTSLYFVWEEWGHLWDAVASPFWGLMQSYAGYVSPLGRLLFLVEAKIFGHWYPGYIVVNVLLIIGFVSLLWKNFRPMNQRASWALAGGLATFMVSGGPLFAATFAAMNAYLLSWLLGLSALTAWRAGRRPTLVGALLFLAALSSSLMNVVVASFVVSAMIVLGRRNGEASITFMARIRGPIGYGLFSASLSLALYIIGRSFPSVDPLVASQQSLAVSEGTSISDVVITVLALLAAWFVAPFIGILTINQNLYERSVIFLLEYEAVLVVILGIVVGLILLVLSQRLGGVGFRRGGAVLLLLTSGVGFAMQLALFRADQGYAVRYTLMWMPAFIVFWASLIGLAQGRAARSLAKLGAVALVASSVVTMAISPFFADQVIDLVRPRTTLSLELKDAVLQCGDIAEPDVADVLAPGMPWEAVCDSADFLRR